MGWNLKEVRWQTFKGVLVQAFKLAFSLQKGAWADAHLDTRALRSLDFLESFITNVLLSMGHLLVLAIRTLQCKALELVSFELQQFHVPCSDFQAKISIRAKISTLTLIQLQFTIFYHPSNTYLPRLMISCEWQISLQQCNAFLALTNKTIISWNK